MVRLLLPFFLLLLVGCQQTSEPISLDELAASARGGEVRALEQLVGLLGENGALTNDRVYVLLLELGDDAIPVLLPAVKSNDRIQREYVIAALSNLKAQPAIPAISDVLADQTLGPNLVPRRHWDLPHRSPGCLAAEHVCALARHCP
jgi:hypothetical protein